VKELGVTVNLDDEVVPGDHRAVHRPCGRRPSTPFLLDDLTEDDRSRNGRLSTSVGRPDVHLAPGRSLQRAVDHAARHAVENYGARYQIGALGANNAKTKSYARQTCIQHEQLAIQHTSQPLYDCSIVFAMWRSYVKSGVPYAMRSVDAPI